ncbi:1-acyl-sn-glycerol-3-phosphate acyltransferase [Lewinella marina]|uniref:Phospholipid/glycerol acyltransferase domain-containing protein n=1 Tax=Neolewinella marina TaxID=438751 RepID=A0A2G0CFE6_9BACT|nr:1-acyl-sn-glycerol-3-phosphate acyltransferase [Neolewinella marina]NJB85672.1 1-acyl-sn-glycerol-3-phosphate acyltransferase [Neolewinella marina]PHK98647.1 hypothetical protein CGL56_09255 [Neolewinella marina]
MLYYLVRPAARFVLSFYYRNIDITGLEHIPRDAPVILAANHPTAFLEPCLMACFQPRTLHFLARGDLFQRSWAKVLLGALNLLPVYRIQDGGYEKLVRNYDTFKECFDVLSRQGALMILAEGRCIHEKRLRPLRKGTARIALGALEYDNTLRDVYIVPVGVNFSAADRVRSKVMIRCGEPLRASHYLREFRHNEAGGIRSLTDALRTALSPLVVQCPEGMDAAAFEPMLTVRRNAVSTAPEGITHSGLELEAELATAADPGLPGKSPGALRYATLLQQFGLHDRDLAAAAGPGKKPWMALPATLLLLPQLPGWLLAETTGLTGPKTIEFYSAVRFAALAVITLLYIPLLIFLPWTIALWLVASLLTTRWSIRQLEACRDWRQQRRLSQVSPEDQRRLREAREALL